MIVHMLDRLKLAGKPELIIINTSTNTQDDVLVEIARKEGVKCFRGDENDVLKRLYEAAMHYRADLIISCTADNPFVDPVYIDKLIDSHMAQGNDFTCINGLPMGVSSYAVNKNAVKKVLGIKDKTDTETWTAYFTDTGMFKVGVLEVEEPFFRRPDIRLTVDYKEDFELISRIFDNLYKKGCVFNLKEILNFLNKHSELIEINGSMKQKPLVPIKLKKSF